MQDLKTRKPNYPFNILRQSEICETNSKFDQKRFNILKNGKSSMPYDLLTLNYLFKTTEVPPKEDYYSEIKCQSIDQATYDGIKNFWSSMNCANLGTIKFLFHTTTNYCPFQRNNFFQLNIALGMFPWILYYWLKYSLNTET